MEVVQVDGSGLVGQGRHRHDPRRRRGLDLVQQEARKEEVAKVVRPDLHLEPVLSLGEWAHHDSGVVDEDVDALLLLVDILGALTDGLQARQVAPVEKMFRQIITPDKVPPWP